MATYKDIHGSSIQNVDGNPDNPKAGQFWYDSSISEFKYQDQFKGSAWSTGNSLNTARAGLGGNGTQTSALAYGGFVSYPGTTATEEYNGTSWTTVNSMILARRFLGSAGASKTSALAFGGKNSPFNPDEKTNATEEFTGNAPATVTISGS